MPANTKLNSREFVCIDKRIGYLALLIIPAVILIVISSMVNSQKMTQNSRASENLRPTTILIPTLEIKKEYRTAAISVCFKVLDDIAPLTTLIRYERSEGTTRRVDNNEAAWKTCNEELIRQIAENNGVWPGTQINSTNQTSTGWQVADSIARIWLANGYILRDNSNKAGFNFPETQWQEFLRRKIMEKLKNQRELLGL